MRAGRETALAKVVAVFGAVKSHKSSVRLGSQHEPAEREGHFRRLPDTRHLLVTAVWIASRTLAE